MPTSSVLTHEASIAIQRVNARHWPTRRQARRRARRGLQAGEESLLTRYQFEFSGTVLELGSCGDGLTAALAQHAASLTGIGASVPTVELCRERFPDADFRAHGLLDLDAFTPGEFDAIVAGGCAIDLLGVQQRQRLLELLNPLLADDGVLIFSSHNLAHESLLRNPVRQALAHPLSLWRLPEGLRNRAHLAHLQQREHGFAVLNGPAADYGLLHQHVSHAFQQRQLTDHDFELLECVTPSGDPGAGAPHAYRQPALYYVARPTGRRGQARAVLS